METFILFCLGVAALNSLIFLAKHLRNMWVGNDAGVSFVLACFAGTLLVFEVKAFQWLWQLDDRFDLGALARSVGI